MVTIIFVEFGGKRHVVEAKEGLSLMQAAVENLVPGIAADCGGYCNCGTCHAYFDVDWFATVGPASDIEDGMLDCAIERKPTSRLTCQITVTPELDGVVVQLPERQT